MSLRSLPPWLDGALFGGLAVPLMFLLKIICPLQTGCFADPFLVIVFSPLLLLELIFGNIGMPIYVEITFIMLFWGTVGGVAAHLWSNLMHPYGKNLPVNKPQE